MAHFSTGANGRYSTGLDSVADTMAAMNRKILAYAAIAVGAALALFSGLGDAIGVGSSEAFGWKQILGLAVGVALIAAGLGMRVPRTPTDAAESPSNANGAPR